MRIAYLIFAYHKPQMLLRIIRSLDDGKAVFLIHFDKNGADADYRLLRNELASPRFHFMEREPVLWGHFSFTRAILHSIAYLIENKIDFDYAILFSGQHYPIKTPGQIGAFLEVNNGKIFILGEAMPTKKWGKVGQTRIERWNYRIFNKNFSFPPLPISFPVIYRRKFIDGFRPYGGNTWWCLPKDIVAYVNEFVRNNPGFLSFFETVHIPDEIFFQTILMNSEYNDRIINNNLLFEIWVGSKRHPELLTGANFETIKKSDKLFARKFDMEVDPQILDRIDRELLHQS